MPSLWAGRRQLAAVLLLAACAAAAAAAASTGAAAAAAPLQPYYHPSDVAAALEVGAVYTFSGKVRDYTRTNYADHKQDTPFVVVVVEREGGLRPLYLTIANLETLGPPFPAGWGWDAAVTVTGTM